jgi:hypothetical protein
VAVSQKGQTQADLSAQLIGNDLEIAEVPLFVNEGVAEFV